jgi:hypothetical protein
MSILATAQMRQWIEMWREEVMASIPTSELKHKFHNQQIKKGRISTKPPKRPDAGIKGGGELL